MEESGKTQGLACFDSVSGNGRDGGFRMSAKPVWFASRMRLFFTRSARRRNGPIVRDLDRKAGIQ